MNQPSPQPRTRADAVAFFATLFGGEYLVNPSGIEADLFEAANVIYCLPYYGECATCGGALLTRAVFLAHDTGWSLRIISRGHALVMELWPHEDGDPRRPSLEEAVAEWREHNPLPGGSR